MKIVVTGSLGNISKPLTKELVQRGHAVTVISSDAGKQAAIEDLGAAAAIGKIEDADFVTATFAGADAAYCMIPMNFKEADQAAYYRKVGSNYVQAIKQNNVGRVVNLSGWAAHVVSVENPENFFDGLSNVGVTHLRPTIFYTNFYDFKGMIEEGTIAANFGGEDKIVLVAPSDIAAAAAEELETPMTGDAKVRYAASDEMTCNEAARILGTAIGKPDLKWATLTDEQMLSGLKSFGMPPQLAAAMVEMQAAIHSGAALADYYRHKPAVMGKVKFTDFAKEFAAVYHRQQ